MPWTSEEITQWSVCDVPKLKVAKGGHEELQRIKGFLVNRKMNECIRLWQGHQFGLHKVDVVTSTSIGIGDFDIQDSKMQLQQPFLRLLDSLKRRRLNDMHVVDTQGLIPAKLMIHVCAPRYSEKYRTAAENALSQCYRVFLETAAEKRCRSIAIGNHSRHGKPYPYKLAAHIAIRTIRKFLEREYHNFESIVICAANPDEFKAFNEVMPYYFPRNEDEYYCSTTLNQKDVGNDIGEAWLPERQIPIDNSLCTCKLSPKFEQPCTPDGVTRTPISNKRHLSPLTPLSQNILENDLAISFMSPAPTPDASRNVIMFPKLDTSCPRTGTFGNRSLWWKRALCADLSHVISMKIFYYAGTDLCGRPILMFVGAHVKFEAVSTEEILYQCIREIEGIGDQPYVIVYAHTDVESKRLINSLDFFYQFYILLSKSQKRNLEAIFVLHPTFTLKSNIHLRQLGLGFSMWRKVVFCSQLQNLWNFVDAKYLQLPEFISLAECTKNQGE